MTDAFNLRNLSVLAYAQGFTLWAYKLAHNQDTGSVFFRDAGDMLAAGDMILVSGPWGGRIAVVTSVGESLSVGALS